MIFSTDIENTFGKIQHTSMIKKNTLNKLEIQRNYLNIIKATSKKLIVNIILNGKKLKAPPLTSGIRQ